MGKDASFSVRSIGLEFMMGEKKKEMSQKKEGAAQGRRRTTTKKKHRRNTRNRRAACFLLFERVQSVHRSDNRQTETRTGKGQKGGKRGPRCAQSIGW
jgi:hypothetical protein